MLTEETPGSEVIIACNPNAVPTNMRKQWDEAGRLIYAAVQEIQEMPTGYGFRLSPDSAMLLKVAEYITNERLCCPFLHFTVEVEPHGGPFWLHLTGGEGVKEYIWSVFKMNNLLNEHIIKAAGLQ